MLTNIVNFSIGPVEKNNKAYLKKKIKCTLILLDWKRKSLMLGTTEIHTYKICLLSKHS